MERTSITYNSIATDCPALWGTACRSGSLDVANTSRHSRRVRDRSGNWPRNSASSDLDAGLHWFKQRFQRRHFIHQRQCPWFGLYSVNPIVQFEHNRSCLLCRLCSQQDSQSTEIVALHPFRFAHICRFLVQSLAPRHFAPFLAHFDAILHIQTLAL